MIRNHQENIVLHNAVSLKTATFAAATTDIITSNAHGLTEGDKVRLTTTGTLPAGLSLAKDYWVFAVTTNTFKLTAAPIIRRISTDPGYNQSGYTAVDITDTGSGTHTFTISSVSQPALISDFRHQHLTIASTGMGSGDTIAVTLKVSSALNAPDFKSTASATNQWEAIQTITLEGGDAVDGTTTLTWSNSDLVKQYAVNTDSGRWLCADITSQTDTANTSVTVSLSLYN